MQISKNTNEGRNRQASNKNLVKLITMMLEMEKQFENSYAEELKKQYHSTVIEFQLKKYSKVRNEHCSILCYWRLRMNRSHFFLLSICVYVRYIFQFFFLLNGFESGKKLDPTIFK